MVTWPEADPAWQNDNLLFDIDVVQKVVGLGREARSQSGVELASHCRVCWCVRRTMPRAKALADHQDQVLEELNIKNVEFLARDADIVNYRIKPNLPKLGKEGHGKNLPAIRKALEDADGKEIAGATTRGENYVLAFAGGEISLTPEDVLVETSSAEGYACAEDVGYLVALDTSLDEDLINEGVAREIVRSVQDARKQAGLEVSDRIVLGVAGTAAVEKALKQHREYVMAETLATDWSVGQPDALFTLEKSVDDQSWTIEINKV